MSDYAQPDFYRFNQDSLELVKFILERDLSVRSILDLGAGCGVIGIELARALQVNRVSFLELQEVYRPFIEKNSLLFLSKNVQTDIIFSSFKNWKSEEKFDLIVSNPPYYLPSDGQPSKDHRRNLARSFAQDSWVDLLVLIEKQLDPNGRAFLVLKNLPSLKCEITKTKIGRSMTFHEKNNLLFIELS